MKDTERIPAPVGPFRVEHRSTAGTTFLARVERCFPHHTELVPFAAHLHLRGETSGEVVMVEESSGVVVARRNLQLGLHRRGERAVR